MKGQNLFFAFGTFSAVVLFAFVSIKWSNRSLCLPTASQTAKNQHGDALWSSFSAGNIRAAHNEGSAFLYRQRRQEVRYHESFVHPAVMALAEAPKRVLIVGDRHGGILREILKYRTIEKVTLVEVDAASASRLQRAHANTQFGDCSFLGKGHEDENRATKHSSHSCLEDARVEIISNQRFSEWFTKSFGKDACKMRQDSQKQKLHYDIVLLDYYWPVSKFAPTLEQSVLTPALFQSLACVMTKAAVLVMNIGEAPEAPFRMGYDSSSQQDRDNAAMFQRKLDQINEMGELFFHTRVYNERAVLQDNSVDGVGNHDLWAFAVGMVPRVEIKDIGFYRGIIQRRGRGKGEFKQEDYEYEYVNVGVTDFDGKAARINLKLRRWLLPGLQLHHYDGARQQSFKYPTADWQGVYCVDADNKALCEVTKLFTEDNGDEIGVVLSDGAGKNSGALAKRDIPKGYVSGLVDAATSLELPSVDLHRLKHPDFTNRNSEAFDMLYSFINHFGYLGTVGVGRTGEMSYTGLLTPVTFINHACNGTENIGDLSDLPGMQALDDSWNPVGDRIRSELNHVMVAKRDIQAGEWVTMDYSSWDGEEGSPVYKEWCG